MTWTDVGFLRGILIRVAAMVAVIATVLTNSASACDTPVYRYAMYRWPTANYFVFFMHGAEATDEQKAVNEALMKLEDGDPPRPNVAFYDVSTKELDVAPRIAVEHWKRIGSPESAYIVIAPPPLGGVVYAGNLTKDDVAAMVTSPARKRMASLLEEGMATVFVVLDAPKTAPEETGKSKGDEGSEKPEGADATPAPPVDNEAAAAETQKIVKAVRDGALELYSAPPKGVAPTLDPNEAKPKHDIAMVRLSRDDPEEKWLIRMLLAVEPDLYEFNQPMVFPVYGRGRVHPPLIGLGISEPNLVDTVEFLTGACSCTVKEENPGVDLLTHYDWDSAAIAVAERFGAEEGNEQLAASDLFPELIIPGQESGEGDEPADTADGNASEEPGAEKTDAAEPGETEIASAESAAEETEVAVVEPPLESPQADGKYSTLWGVGAVLILGLVGLFVATLIILRPR